MKKFLRFLVILIIVVVAVVLILALVEPTDITVTRTTMIKAPKEAVFDQMVTFKNWPNWSPWYQMEPTMKITYSGTDGQPGSGYHWEGDDKKTGTGEMKNTAVTGTQMNFDVSFAKPREGAAHGILKADDTAGMTKATWSFAMHMPFPMNAMGVFMNMDKMLGGDFENGLNNMKKYVESHTTPTAGVDIKEVDYPAHVFEGVRQTVGWNDMSKFFMDTYGMLGKGLGPKINGIPVGIFYTWDTTMKNSDMVAAFPVSDTATMVKGAMVFHAGPVKAAMAVQTGGYSQGMKYHTALQKYVAGKHVKQTMVLEEYVVGPGKEADSSKWVTNIYYMLP